MIFYEIQIASDQSIPAQFVNEDISSERRGRRQKKNEYTETSAKINDRLEDIGDERYPAYCVDLSENKATLLMISKYEDSDSGLIDKAVSKMVHDCFTAHVQYTIAEITTAAMKEKAEKGERRGFIRDTWPIIERYRLDYLENRHYKLKQEIIEEKNVSLDDIRKSFDSQMTDATMAEEAERIYAAENPKKFYGHPVHYKFTCVNAAAGYKMADTLVKALLANERLCSGRVSKISAIDDQCFDEDDLEKLMADSKGGTVVIEMDGCGEDTNFATAYQQVVQYFTELVHQNEKEVLFIFLESTERTGFSKNLVSSVLEFVDLVEIKEGSGSREHAWKYLQNLAEEVHLSGFVKDPKQDFPLEKKKYTASELHRIFNKWRVECLRKSVYTSYNSCRVVRAHPEKRGKAYDDLMGLIGLDSVKEIVRQIIADSVIEKRRRKASGERFDCSRHMIFTGKPGSCKTTVARLLAKTLKEEGVLETGEFVECGRADLTARYVGWTDKTVRAKFRQANGGILFIDEAYSLVEEDGYYGDEAINTIVQEMENHREDVIVIFAGYPDKMQRFLEKNEGLRSRIAFHVSFPDYNADELMRIFAKMLEDRGMKTTGAAKEKVLGYCKMVVTQENFGNGRFVRNLIEQAVMKQSSRLFDRYKGRVIPKDRLLMLETEDFEIENMIPSKQRTRKIGFCA